MGQRGPKPKPTHLKLLAGNPGHTKLNRGEPIPVGPLKEPPAWLTREQVEAWNYAIERSPPGLLKRIDQEALVSWVVQNDFRRRACLGFQLTDMDSELPLLTKKADGSYIPNIYLKIIHGATQLSLKAAAELGFTPSSRSRITTQTDGQEEKNPFARNGTFDEE